MSSNPTYYCTGDYTSYLTVDHSDDKTGLEPEDWDNTAVKIDSISLFSDRT